jgi:16S rRNA (cytosine967-C5)-methyltransferase
MYEPARIESAIELTALVEAAWQRTPPMPADVVINRYFRERRFIGSKDRGFIAALVYFVIRNRGALLWTAERHGFYEARALVIAALALDRKKSIPDLDKLSTAKNSRPND